ncbi:MAG TPA: hypothetical protein DHW02_15085 [Ktedonobacter sp.]|nr:hypothetical protein [Ktedonobacter sp.]
MYKVRYINSDLILCFIAKNMLYKHKITSTLPISNTLSLFNWMTNLKTSKEISGIVSNKVKHILEITPGKI